MHPHAAEVRFYEELNDFLPPSRRKRAFSYLFSGNPSIKDAVEAIGVPHTEVDLILVNGSSVGFGYHLRPGDRVSVYPVFESLDISPVVRLRARPLRRTAFVLDGHLGKLARLLRMFGFDTLYRKLKAGSGLPGFRVFGSLIAFAVAMAYLEAAVVVYLRKIFYPGGFVFPLGEMNPFAYAVEVGREGATIVMLATVACLAASTGVRRLAVFAFLFGIWDISYYIWLKLLLNWPESLLTWDILFLIPVSWIGPVLAPVLISLLLVAGSLRMMRLLEDGCAARVDRWDWLGASAGVLLVLYSFMEDMTIALLQGGAQAAAALVPAKFGWPAFLAGFALMIGVTLRVTRRSGRGRGTIR
ncbi:MAG: hypothetical protein KAY24_01415 [Candidatus Eisenbacteria sp.]|nr:hypothetical protein [Candidatus Eisenbacteria bacterium]